MPYDFQQRMSWLPQRWRTQRNAIRNANCISSWIIKSLNAHCTSGICPGVCLFECPQTPLNQFNFWLSRIALDSGIGRERKTFLPLLKFRALRDNTSNAVQSSPLWYCCSHDFYLLRPLLYLRLSWSAFTLCFLRKQNINFHSDLKLSKKTRWI